MATVATGTPSTSSVATLVTGPPPPTAGPTCPVSGEVYPHAAAGKVGEVPGIPYDETYPLTILPGGSQPVAASIPPLTELTLTGEARTLGAFDVWVEVTAPGDTGWVAKYKLVYLGGEMDRTAAVVAGAGGVPMALSMLDLGDIVLSHLVPSDPAAPPAEVVLVASPGAGSPSTAIYDTFPGEFFGSDTDIGSRYLVTGVLVPGSPDMWVLDTAISQALCTRGVDSPTGFCV